MVVNPTYLQGRVGLGTFVHGHMVKTDPILETCETILQYFSDASFFLSISHRIHVWFIYLHLP